jgi:hypothetical protein
VLEPTQAIVDRLTTRVEVMIVRLAWPGYRHAGESVDAFWVECTPEESARLVDPRMSTADRASIAEMERTYGWPHFFDGEDRCCFLVAPDSSFIRAFQAHYPNHQLWNGYSPFRAIPTTSIDSVDDLATLRRREDG